MNVQRMKAMRNVLKKVLAHFVDS